MTVLTLLFVLELFKAVMLVAAGGIIVWLAFLAVPGLVGGAPYVGSKKRQLDAMMRLAAIRPGELLIDLGSGDGRILAAAAKAGGTAFGYEINLFLVWYARLKLWRQGLRGRVRVRWGNFWRADLSKADVVAVFGFSTVMENLAHKLDAELKPGARVVSVRYVLPGRIPEASADGVYLYKIAERSAVSR